MSEIGTDDLVLVTEYETMQVRATQLRDLAAFILSLSSAPPGSYTDADADLRVAAGIATHEAAGNPHPIYLTQTEGDALYSVLVHDHDADYEVIGAVAAHEAAGNPHPTYLTQAEGDALYSVLAHDHDADYEPLGAVATHVGLADPHTQYLLESAFNLSTFTTTNLAEGANLYYTDERVDDRVNALFVEGAGIDLSYNDGANTFTVTVDLSELSTTTLPEGSNLYYTNERVDDRVAALLIEGTNITLTYDDGANTLTIDAASGSGNFGVTTADFGAFPGKQQILVTVSGQSGLISTTKIQTWLAPIATSDHGLDDHICESQFLKATPYYSVDGTFIIQVETINPPQTRYPPSRQGDIYRVWDEFSIGWSWTN